MIDGLEGVEVPKLLEFRVCVKVSLLKEEVVDLEPICLFSQLPRVLSENR